MALTPTNAWWLLLIFRCIQASGSASTVALGSGVVADVATPAERGSFYGATAVGALVSGTPTYPRMPRGSHFIEARAVYWAHSWRCLGRDTRLAVDFLDVMHPD